MVNGTAAPIDKLELFGQTSDPAIAGDWNLSGISEIGMYSNSTHSSTSIITEMACGMAQRLTGSITSVYG